MQEILETENWNVFEDESNESQLFLRNRIRKRIVPLLEKEGLNPNKLYDNFHNNSIYDENINKSVEISHLKIDRHSLDEISLGNLKLILDGYAIILKIHPFSKKILMEVKKELTLKTSFLIENKEIIIWKNPSSDLTLIPKKSSALKKPKIIIEDGFRFLNWNSKKRKLSFESQINTMQKGLKILINNKHFEISELFREKQVPLPIREVLPILFKENQPSAILFSLWDDRMKDYIGDLFL